MGSSNGEYGVGVSFCQLMTEEDNKPLDLPVEPFKKEEPKYTYTHHPSGQYKDVFLDGVLLKTLPDF